MEELTIGQRIAVKRKELGLSQIELGEHMGVSRQSVSKWEADAAIPEIDKLIALSKLFHVSVGWLLGVEENEEPEQPPEQTFTPREWEIIDRLTQEKPRLPKWLMPLAAFVTAVAFTASLLAGIALHSAHSRRQELAAISQSIANITTSLGAGLADISVLEEYSFQAHPSDDLSECTFVFTGVPVFHEPDSSAELIVVLGADAVVRQECRWTGTCYTAEFTLPAYNGYTASFCLTDRDGIVRASRVYDFLLYNLMDHRGFGNVFVEFGQRNHDGSNLLFYDGADLIFDQMRVHIEAPKVFRDCTDIWARCDLVILGDGEELGRIDLLNRSAYSKKVNFSGIDVDFFTKDQRVTIGSVNGISKLEVVLFCKLSTGLQMQTFVDTLDFSGWR